MDTNSTVSARPEVRSGNINSNAVNDNQHSTQQDAVTASLKAPGTKSKNKTPKSQRPCRFFGTAGGCRAGSQCPFLHASTLSKAESVAGNATEAHLPPTEKAKNTRTPKRQYQARPVDQSKVVAKPAPSTSISKRDHQIGQVKRRFSPTETALVDSTILSFKLQPTDPDFPYELEALECVLQIPKNFPEDEPHLSIHNKEMEKGFRINIENGFKSIIRSSPNGNLLSWLNALDRQLESLLSGKKADTIKFVANRATTSGDATTQPAPILVVQEPKVAPPLPRQAFEPVYSEPQRQAATIKRDMDTRQLEARLGRQAMYAKSSDGIAYTLPIEPRKKGDLPTALQNVRSVRLFVPMLYPLLPCRIALQGVPRDTAQSVEQAFEQKARENSDTTLIGHINYLVTHMHIMAEQTEKKFDFEADEIGIEELILSDNEEDQPDSISINKDAADDRKHLHFVPRPPEWHIEAQATHEPASDESDDMIDDSETEEEITTETATVPERGVSVDFPHLQLHGIELLNLISLNLMVRCSRCKEETEVDNLRHTESNSPSSRALGCKKCASELSIAFHHQLVHTNSTRAGYLDLENCTVADMLLSKFAPTCANCSTTHTDPAVSAVRGDTTLTICRKCHAKMSFHIPEVKFLLVSSSAKALPVRKAKKPRENLGIRSGEPLPRHGRCKHYAKSYRWFRFGCCAKVYPCDRCHDEKEAHPNEHANRMICGYCSREQRYRPEDCSICKAILVGKKYTGFWEGGQGTRDKVRMSRKDPRKYKRRGGATTGGA